ncbi:HDOD domain-containing protein [Hahella sp. KA22]|uniref:HDOD domain-containing protein n=1 Tax=Hahella sp. KA22 TaxID=1628392 RepID=UPI000FDF3910|nr:HDOD domain-containing protein [Hahella sp. KA22]AZZ93461.1 HDOD domain-containing protein [Hahella sp. KA22]QAY56835.1 HDOD domain-containing protein [Hahella sp. KA22]
MPDTHSSADPLTQELDSRIQAGNLDIPMLPEVAQKVIAITNNPDSGASELVKVIQGDQALAARVMRIANSAAYSPNASIVSLQQAIARLGMVSIRDIALAASINARMFKAPGYEERIGAMWRHALATALWCKEIARRTRMNVEAAFLCGLLHSVGKPIMLQETLDVAGSEGLQPELDLLLEIVDELHLDAARLALEHWRMPELIIDAVTHQDNYQEAGNGKDQAKLIRAGKQFASHFLFDEPDKDTLLALPAMADLNLYPDEVAELYEQSETVNQGLEAMRA